jgi:minor extracellular serine protease Vpr
MAAGGQITKEEEGRKTMRRKSTYALLVLALVLSLPLVAFAQKETRVVDRSENRGLPGSVDELKLSEPIEVSGIDLQTLQQSPFAAAGPGKVIIRLTADSVAEAKAKGKALGQAKKEAEAQQESFLERVLAADPKARVIAQVQVVMNAVFVEVDAAALPVLAKDPAVLRIAPVKDYQMDLSETVPYIGATAVHDAGYDGTGVRVAVLDSGIDYTHAALGGSGNPAEYAANDPTIIEPGTFPTAKVVGGYDFVGSNWYGSGGPPLAPDPDPLDDGPGAGHGTHVAHIIGGVGGVAPGVDLYAVKVCSSISTACSGIALMEGMEFAVDPNGDGDPGDHVDVINMSLGADYGNAYDDDLSFAVDNATALGVLTVAAAGNGADKPYVAGTPANAPTAISVAQTNVPSAIQPLLEIVSAAVFQAWSAPLTARIEGPLQYGDGAGGQLLGCSLGPDPNAVDPGTEPFPPGSLTGKIVLVDRGVCNFSIKIYNVQRGGGVAGIIGLVAPGDPFAGSYGAGGPYTIPGYMISQADSNLLKSLLPGGVTVAFDPAFGIPLIQHMVGSSSRGPAMGSSIIKPEIGAPGASVSAIAGTGTGEGPFGGTSGASPMVAGSAALLLQAYPGRSPLEVKAALMNSAETDIMNLPAFFGGTLAPISRIGGGEVRVDRAFSAPAAAWEDGGTASALSFGYVDVPDETLTLHKMVRVHNYSNHDVVYSITPTFRFADDEATGAVSVQAPPKVKVKARRDATFPVKLTINGAMLPGNFMNSGSQGANPAALTINEYDGYLILDDGSHPIHLAWHVLPRKAALVKGRTNLTFEAGTDVVDLTNTAVGTAQDDAYSLLALSPNIPEGGRGEQSPTPDIHGVGINTFPVPAGYCSGQDSFVWAFAVNTWERQSLLLPVSHQIGLDTNRDGTTDYVVLNRDASGLSTISDGRQLTWVVNLGGGPATAYFYAEHATNTGNTALYICAEQVGLTGTDMLATNVDMYAYAQDFYYGGPGDMVEGLTVTPLGEQYYGMPEDIAGKAEGILTVYDLGPFPGNTPELGVMLFTNGDRGTGNRGGATQDTEALFFMAR